MHRTSAGRRGRTRCPWRSRRRGHGARSYWPRGRRPRDGRGAWPRRPGAPRTRGASRGRPGSSIRRKGSGRAARRRDNAAAARPILPARRGRRQDPRSRARTVVVGEAHGEPGHDRRSRPPPRRRAQTGPLGRPATGPRGVDGRKLRAHRRQLALPRVGHRPVRPVRRSCVRHRPRRRALLEQPKEGRGQAAESWRWASVRSTTPARTIRGRVPRRAGRCARVAPRSLPGRAHRSSLARTTSTRWPTSWACERREVLGERVALGLARLRRHVADVHAERLSRPRSPSGCRARAGSAAGSCTGCPDPGRCRSAAADGLDSLALASTRAGLIQHPPDATRTHDLRLPRRAPAVRQLGVQRERHGRHGHDLAAHGEDAVRQADALLEVAARCRTARR